MPAASGHFDAIIASSKGTALHPRDSDKCQDELGSWREETRETDPHNPTPRPAPPEKPAPAPTCSCQRVIRPWALGARGWFGESKHRLPCERQAPNNYIHTDEVKKNEPWKRGAQGRGQALSEPSGDWRTAHPKALHGVWLSYPVATGQMWLLRIKFDFIKFTN